MNNQDLELNIQVLELSTQVEALLGEYGIHNENLQLRIMMIVLQNLMNLHNKHKDEIINILGKFDK